MEILIDTANTADTKKYNELYNIAGVTTNPTILSKEKRDFFELYYDIKNIIGDKQLHIQVTAESWPEIVKEAECITKNIDKNIYIKVPTNEQGIKAIKELKQRGINVTATAIFVPQQALMAASVGADYIAPYLNRMSSFGIDGIATIGEIIDLFKVQNLSTKVLTASFKNTQQIVESFAMGADAATVAVELLSQMFINPLIESTIQTFKNNWINTYGDKRIYELNVDRQ